MKIKLKYKNAVEIGPYTEDHGKGIVLYFHEKSKAKDLPDTHAYPVRFGASGGLLECSDAFLSRFVWNPVETALLISAISKRVVMLLHNDNDDSGYVFAKGKSQGRMTQDEAELFLLLS